MKNEIAETWKMNYIRYMKNEIQQKYEKKNYNKEYEKWNTTEKKRKMNYNRDTKKNYSEDINKTKKPGKTEKLSLFRWLKHYNNYWRESFMIIGVQGVLLMISLLLSGNSVGGAGVISGPLVIHSHVTHCLSLALFMTTDVWVSQPEQPLSLDLNIKLTSLN